MSGLGHTKCKGDALPHPHSTPLAYTYSRTPTSLPPWPSRPFSMDGFILFHQCVMSKIFVMAQKQKIRYPVEVRPVILELLYCRFMRLFLSFSDWVPTIARQGISTCCVCSPEKSPIVLPSCRITIKQSNGWIVGKRWNFDSNFFFPRSS